MPISSSFAFTCGLWMISPTRRSAPVGELVAGLVGVIHRAVHAVAEAELPGQPKSQRADRQASSPGRGAGPRGAQW